MEHNTQAFEKKKMSLTQDDFDKLLAWLDSDRERAGNKYEEIRRHLIKIFVCRGCQDPEELADITFNRVARKVEEVAKTYVGNPALYFYGVAHKVHKEYLRRKQAPAQPMPVQNEEVELAYECLEDCLQDLAIDNRDLILRYYYEDKRLKIDNRKELADRLGVAISALRTRVHRIRAALQKCVQRCIEQRAVQRC